MGIAHAAIGKRFARLDGNLPQRQLPQRLHGRLEVVFLAHRHAAAGDDGVVPLRGLAQRCHGGLALVGHIAQVGDFTAQALQQGAQHKAVAVVDAAWRQLLRRHRAGHDQFVSRREQRYARAAHHREAVEPNAGSQTEGRRREPGARLQHRRALGDVFPGTANVLPGAHSRLHAHPRTLLQHFTLLLHDHGTGTRRHGRTRENARRLARQQGLAHTARRNALGNGKFQRPWRRRRPICG